MPDNPQGNDSFEYDNNRNGNQYKSICSEEELGDMHLATESYSVALEYYEKALQKAHAVTHEPSDLVRVYLKISDCYRKKGFIREASAFLESASSHCTEEDVIGEGTIACRRAIILRMRGEIKEALREGCSAYKILRRSDQHKEVAHTQLHIANCYLRLGRHEEAEQFFLDSLSSYRRINDSVGESYVLNNLGLFHKNACRWGRALQFLNKALVICEKVGLSQHKVRVTLNIGVVHLKKRDFANAESSFSAARVMARRIGDDIKYTRATLMLGVKETKCGNLIAAEKHLLEGRVIAERRNYLREISLADEFVGDLMLTRGDLKGALENYTIALSEAKKLSEINDVVAELIRRIMYIHLIRKKPEQVISMSHNALKVCRKAGELHEIGYVERTIGQAYALMRDDTAAEKSINRSIRTFLSVNNPYDAHISGIVLGELLIKRDDRKSVVMARKLVGETVSFFERNEEFRDLANSHFLLAKIEEMLGNRDESLLHIYEAERLAEDLDDRNLNRRLRRMRKKIEIDTAGDSVHSGGTFTLPEDVFCFAHDPHLRSYLDYILSDMMRKVAAGHGFVALTGSSTENNKPYVLASSGISEENIFRLTDWFMSRSDNTEKFLVTNSLKDRRTKEIRDIFPGGDSPVYFHPMNKDGKPFGLIFFQSENDGGKVPRVGSIFDIVSTYAGSIGFLIRGILGSGENTAKEKFDRRKFQRIITRSDQMLRILDLAEKVAVSGSTVLLMGETGTGKGLIAKAIHRLSARANENFIHVNCAALPEQLFESELFGHVKGSFTGAVDNKKGLLAEADGGTIFLDEIDKSPLSIQGKLLQFLDSKKIRPVGGNEEFSVDVRLIFASKLDLISKCSDGTILEDFFYRINDFPITVPPLRDRTEDITLLAEHYLRLFCDRADKKIVGFSEEALDFLKTNRWPGNVREFEKTIKRAVILADDNDLITLSHLTLDGSCDKMGSGRAGMTLPEKVRELEKRSLSESLDRNSWNRKTAAKELGISYPTLLKKVRDFGLSSG
ncbi:MAG: sigma 54-interacting transcriptional regulator [Candidatus Krumholzibacteriota bacterium]|nr:sigma 54-interacting transcriptional regulator [Candidatus Krumholzibacteriota bacterium]